MWEKKFINKPEMEVVHIDLKRLTKLSSLFGIQVKQEYMESLFISTYKECFDRKGDYKLPITEMKFSNDSKFCFVCMG